MISIVTLDRLIISVFLVATLCVMYPTPIAMAQAETEAERIARVEGTLEHLATKEDVVRVETQVLTLRAELEGARWFFATFISIAAIIAPLIFKGLSCWINRE